MRIDGSIPPTIPFHVAKAYAAQSAAPSQPAPRADTPAVVGRVAPKPAAPTSQPRIDALIGGSARELVAAKVPGGIDFSGSQPAPTADAIPMYRAPWDKNAAAVAVAVGRSLDVSG